MYIVQSMLSVSALLMCIIVASAYGLTVDQPGHREFTIGFAIAMLLGLFALWIRP